VPISGVVRAVNLLPPDLRGASKTTAELSVASEASGGAGPFVVLGVLAACVAGIAGYVLTDNTIKQRQADLAAVTAHQQSLAAEAAKLKPYADYDAKAKARVQTVKDLAGSRFDWEQALRDLSRAIPGNVTLKELSGNVNADSGTGGGGSSLRSAIAAPAITLTGCTTDQSGVARLMSRLRGIDGVTRVSLAKSDVTTVADSGDASGGATAQRNAAPCGIGDRPQFQLVVFFEHASAAVSAPPAGSATTPGATPTATPTPTATATETATPTPSSGDEGNSAEPSGGTGVPQGER
jgi:Tfp pilus assembly protein PilN